MLEKKYWKVRKMKDVKEGEFFVRISKDGQKLGKTLYRKGSYPYFKNIPGYVSSYDRSIRKYYASNYYCLGGSDGRYFAPDDLVSVNFDESDLRYR